MSKNEEKIIISKKLANDLLWWIKNAPIPNNDGAWMERWGRNKQSHMELAWESLVYDLKQAIEQAEIKHLKREIAQLKKEQARDNLEIERLEECYKNSTYSALEQVGTEKTK